MGLLKMLHKEEHKLLASYSKIEGKLRGIRAAINAVASNGHDGRTGHDKRKGRKLSASHRRAIKAGIAKAKAEK